MKTQPKILLIIIGILLIANIATLSFFLLGRNERTRSGRQDRKAQLTAFLKKDVGFTAGQLGKFDTLSKEHHDNMKTVFDDMSAGREIIFKKLAAQSFSDSGINLAAKAIAEQQRGFELKMLFYLRDIHNICSAAQQPVFDSGYSKIIARRGNGKKDN